MIFHFFSRIYDFVVSAPQTDIDAEVMEKYRMISGFKEKEIIRLRFYFKSITNDAELMSKELFLGIECIANNPLNDRICICFGFENGNNINFEGFLKGVASFNSPGLKEEKLRVAFRIQDFDGDGVLSRSDLYKYIERITNNNLVADDINRIIDEMFKEVSTGINAENISFAQFQTIVVPLDFQARLMLPI
jgi:Ca2+-binding EF-hand superfamily protein